MNSKSGTTGKPDLDVIDAVMTWEDDDASEEDRLNAMQRLIDSGVVWSLQGSYGRAANRLIEAGTLRRALDPLIRKVLRDHPSTAHVNRGDR